MAKVKANHYTESLIYKVDQIIKWIKSDLNQYISSLEIGLTSEQFAVLDTVYNMENICQQDVAKILSKDKSNIKRIVEILEKNSLITRISGKKNNRLVNYLKITKKGKQILDGNLQNIKNHIENSFNFLCEEEIEYLRTIARKFEDIKHNKNCF